MTICAACECRTAAIAARHNLVLATASRRAHRRWPRRAAESVPSEFQIRIGVNGHDAGAKTESFQHTRFEHVFLATVHATSLQTLQIFLVIERATISLQVHQVLQTEQTTTPKNPGLR